MQVMMLGHWRVDIRDLYVVASSQARCFYCYEQRIQEAQTSSHFRGRQYLLMFRRAADLID